MNLKKNKFRIIEIKDNLELLEQFLMSYILKYLTIYHIFKLINVLFG